VGTRRIVIYRIPQPLSHRTEKIADNLHQLVPFCERVFTYDAETTTKDGPFESDCRRRIGPAHRYTGGSPVDEDRFYWFATAPEPLTGDHAAPEAVESALRHHLTGYPEPIPEILDGLDPADLVVTDLEDLPSLDTWSRNRVVLAGDAAHAMPPFAGQAAAQAIEDGLMLADALATYEDHERAFDAYESERKPRADRVRGESHRLGRFGTMQSTLGCRLRNVAIDTIPDAVFRRIRRRQAAGTSLPE
jgi:2-polyprenyl-6-methoxyphenol hydroxylase-like FAD-dependent oxidoreductase